MIEQVEEVRAEREIVLLTNVECFDERQVPVLLERSAKRVARNVAIAGGGG